MATGWYTQVGEEPGKRKGSSWFGISQKCCTKSEKKLYGIFKNKLQLIFIVTKPNI